MNLSSKNYFFQDQSSVKELELDLMEQHSPKSLLINLNNTSLKTELTLLEMLIKN
jgi:hypothetical protein